MILKGQNARRQKGVIKNNSTPIGFLEFYGTTRLLPYIPVLLRLLLTLQCLLSLLG